MMKIRNVLGCVLTSLLVAGTAWGESTAVSVHDLGCGPTGCDPDGSADIIRHDPSTGAVTLHFLTPTGINLIESDFTLDGLEITDGAAGDNYEPGQITFSLDGFGGIPSGGNNNSTNDNDNSSGGGEVHDGTVASASYEVYGRISDLEVGAPGCNHNQNTAVIPGLSGDFGLRTFSMIAINSNASEPDVSADAYVAPYPSFIGTLGEENFVTAFHVVSGGIGEPNSNFLMTLSPGPNTAAGGNPGLIRVHLGNTGAIETIVHDSGGGDGVGVALHSASASIPDTAHTSVSDGLYYFNQLVASGWGHALYRSDCNSGMIPPTVQFVHDTGNLAAPYGDPVSFSVTPEIELYFGGQVMHVALSDPGDGFTANPVFTDGVVPPPDGFDSSQGGAHTDVTGGDGLQLQYTRKGPIHEIKDFNAGSGYSAIPTLTVVDPGGAGTGAEVNLLYTEAFEGGPRSMAYADTGESVLLPGTGWRSQVGDFDGNGSPDLFWRNASLGASMIWMLQNGHIETTASLPVTESEWRPTVADLDGDGRSEIFWWSSFTGATVVWKITPGASDNWVSSAVPSQTVGDLTWETVGETTRYGRQSILWQNNFDGTVGTWTMSSSSPHVVSTNAMFTYPSGESLVPGANWQVVGTADLNGDGLTGDLLWKADEYHRIAIWLLGNDNFIEGDYLKFNGQEVIIDAGLGGIGTYTSDGNVNLVWNDGTGVVNWQMDRGTTVGAATEEDETPGAGDGLDTGTGRAADDDSDDLSDEIDEDIAEDEEAAQGTETGSSTFVVGQAYRLGSAWRMSADGTLTPYTLEFFEGLPEIPAGEGTGSAGGIGGFGDLDGILDDPLGGSNDPTDPTGGGIGGSITIPAGVDPCQYICDLDPNNPAGWPPEFQTPPPSIIQGIWEVLIDGLLESYGCDPCSGGGIPDPTGACCSSLVDACDIFTEEMCLSLPGTTWLGEDTVCDDCP